MTNYIQVLVTFRIWEIPTSSRCPTSESKFDLGQRRSRETFIFYTRHLLTDASLNLLSIFRAQVWCIIYTRRSEPAAFPNSSVLKGGRKKENSQPWAPTVSPIKFIAIQLLSAAPPINIFSFWEFESEQRPDLTSFHPLFLLQAPRDSVTLDRARAMSVAESSSAQPAVSAPQPTAPPSLGESIEEKCLLASLITIECHFTGRPVLGPKSTRQAISMLSKSLEKTQDEDVR